MTLSWRWIAIVAAAGVFAGGIVGWTLRGEPPPQVQFVDRVEVRYKDRIQTVEVAQVHKSEVTPPRTITRTITKYVTAEAGDCKVAEVIDERDHTGPGKIETESDTSTQTDKESSGAVAQETQQKTAPSLPKWLFSGSIGMNAALPWKPQPFMGSLTIGYRVAGPVYGTATAVAPLNDLTKPALFVGASVGY